MTTPARSFANTPLPSSDHPEPLPADAPSFLDSSRAITVRVHEFDRLVDDVVAQLAQLGMTPKGETPTEVRRAPNRCIVQLGPVALTISWVRGRSELVADGRLLVIEWSGIVGRRSERIPERIPAAKPSPDRTPATIDREAVLCAAASGAEDWRWQREDTPSVGYSSSELATLCVQSLQRRAMTLPQ